MQLVKIKIFTLNSNSGHKLPSLLFLSPKIYFKFKRYLFASINLNKKNIVTN